LEVGFENLSNEPENATETSATVLIPGVHRDALPKDMLTVPRHSSEDVNEILIETEYLIQNMHRYSKHVDLESKRKPKEPSDEAETFDAIFANTYVDLGKVDTVGFDYDYTLVTYTEELLELIYDMALKRLVHDRNYPMEMLDAGLAFDPFFSIRGMCVVLCCRTVHREDVSGRTSF